MQLVGTSLQQDLSTAEMVHLILRRSSEVYTSMSLLIGVHELQPLHTKVTVRVNKLVLLLEQIHVA